MQRTLLTFLAFFVAQPAQAFECTSYAQDTFSEEAANLGAELASVESERVKAGAQDAFDARKALDKTGASLRAKSLREQLPCASEASDIKLARVFFLLGVEGQRRMPPEPESERFLQVALMLLGEEVGVQSTIDAWANQLGADLKAQISKAQTASRGMGAIYAHRRDFSAGLSLHGLPPNPPWVLTPGPVTLDSGVESMQVTVRANKVTLVTPKDLSTATLETSTTATSKEDDFVEVQRSFEGPQTGLVFSVGMSGHLAPLAEDHLPADGAIVPASYGAVGPAITVGGVFQIGTFLLNPRVELGMGGSAVDGTPPEDSGISAPERESLKFVTFHADTAFGVGPLTVATGPAARTLQATLVGAHGACTTEEAACVRDTWQEFVGITTVVGWSLSVHYPLGEGPLALSAAGTAMTDGARNYFSPSLGLTYTLSDQ
jgi:hypothetical protein